MILPGLANAFKHGGYEFTKVTPADMKQIRAWMNEPHIIDWWTPEDQEMTVMEQAEAADSNVVRYMVSYGGRPFAYIQCYDPALDNEYWGDNPQAPGTFGLDQFIGEAEMIGFGHGTNFIKAFVVELKKQPGVKRIIVDPAPDNGPAIRCYSQVGFRKEKTITTPDGPALLMTMTV